MAKKPNLLFFGIDSLRRDHMSLYGYNRLTTPNIQKYVQGGIAFENCFSAHIPTTPGYSNMLTGRDVFGTGVVALAQKEISVSEFFAKNRHLLGFDNPRKALLTTVKEAVDAVSVVTVKQALAAISKASM